MIPTQSHKHPERESLPENGQKSHPKMKDRFGENAMDSNDTQPNEEKLTELRHEFIKSKQLELENLVRKSHFGFTQWDVHLLMTGCTCAVLLANLVAGNAVLAVCSLFTLTLMVNLRAARDAFTHIAAAALVLVESALLVVHACVTQPGGRTDKRMRVLALLLLLALNAHLDSWLALDLNRIGRYNCASNFAFELHMLKSTELLAFTCGAVLMACAAFFVVHLYSVSYILFIIVLFAYTSRWRFALCLERDHATVLDRVKSRKQGRGPRFQSIWRYDSRRSDGPGSSGPCIRGFGSTRLSIRSGSLRPNELNFFPSVQSLITFIIILITLLILVFSVLNNNLLSISRQPHFNEYLEQFSDAYQRKLTIKVKLLCIFSFIMLFAMFVQFALYIFYFFRRTNFLSRLLYSRVVLLFSLCSASKNAYYNLVVTSRPNLAGHAASARASSRASPEPESSCIATSSLNNALTPNNFLNTREMRVESYHLDHWGRVMRVETLCRRQVNSHSYVNNFLDNDNFSCIVKKLTGNKIVRRLTHRGRNIFNRLNTVNNRVKRGLDGRADTVDPFRMNIWPGHPDLSPLSPLSPVHLRPGDESVLTGARAALEEGPTQSGACNSPAASLVGHGCSYPVLGSPRLSARLNCAELYLFVQAYVLVNSQERSLYCLPRQEQCLNLLVHQDPYLIVKNKLAQYNLEFFRLLRFFLDNRLFDSPDFFDNFGHFTQQAQFLFPDQLGFSPPERSVSESADAPEAELLARRRLTRTLSENDAAELSRRGLESIDLSRVLHRIHSESAEVFRLSIPTEFLSSSRSFSTDAGLMPEEEDVVSRFTALSLLARFGNGTPDLGDEAGASVRELDLEGASEAGPDGPRSTRSKHVRGSERSSGSDLTPSQLVSDRVLAREARKRRRVKYLTKFFNRRCNPQHPAESFKPVGAGAASAENSPSGLFADATESALGVTSRDAATAPFTHRSLSERMLAPSREDLTENNPTLMPEDLAALDDSANAEATDNAKDTNRDPAGNLEASNDRAPNGFGSTDASPKNSAAEPRAILKPKASAANKDYELEYVVNSKDSFKKLFSTANAPPTANVRIKRLQLDNHFSNNYMYTRTIKFNTVNKFVLKNDSTGTNLVRDASPALGASLAAAQRSPGPSTPVRSPSGAAFALGAGARADTGEASSPAGAERPQRETPRFSSLYEAGPGPAVDLSRLDTDDLFPDRLIETAAEAEESVEARVNSIMGELLKDLDLDL